MTLALATYRLVTRLFEPAAPLILASRVRNGKEAADRVPERLGRTTTIRPPGPLIWLHGASVGEARLLLDIFHRVRRRSPNASGLLTTQTQTSANLVSDLAPDGVIHQMAPIDGPSAVNRFLDHWRPQLAVFAEGELWPNLLAGLHRHHIPGVLANARMTERSRKGWTSRKASATEMFGTFQFLGAADPPTAATIEAIVGRPVDVVGNLKRAASPPLIDPEQLASWREALGGRKVLLAASTHPTEEAIAADAFVRLPRDNAPLLIIAPRHPERGDLIFSELAARGLAIHRRSVNRSPPPSSVDVLLADTIGELPLWYALSDGVYLGGGHATGVGGHNPMEPALLGKTVFTGPEVFNFTDLMSDLADAGAVVIGPVAQLHDHWTRAISQEPAPSFDASTLARIGAQGATAMQLTVDAIVTALQSPPVDHNA